jgi:hypothetical protein
LDRNKEEYCLNCLLCLARSTAAPNDIFIFFNGLFSKPNKKMLFKNKLKIENFVEAAPIYRNTGPQIVLADRPLRHCRICSNASPALKIHPQYTGYLFRSCGYKETEAAEVHDGSWIHSLNKNHKYISEGENLSSRLDNMP